MLYLLAIALVLLTIALSLRQVGLFYYAQCFRLIAEKHHIALPEDRLDRILGEAPTLYMIVVGVVFSMIWFRRDWVAMSLEHATTYAEESVVERLREGEPEDED